MSCGEAELFALFACGVNGQAGLSFRYFIPNITSFLKFLSHSASLMIFKKMSTDPLDDLLSLETTFYNEGFEAGVADSAHAGLIEGKLFGIEKGYEKALEIGRVHGRALLWQRRLESDGSESAASPPVTKRENGSTNSISTFSEEDISVITTILPPLTTSSTNIARLKKHISTLIALTDPTTLPKDNSDDSVSELEERISKIRARVKMISTMTGESVAPAANAATSIEDSIGLSARH